MVSLAGRSVSLKAMMRAFERAEKDEAAAMEAAKLALDEERLQSHISDLLGEGPPAGNGITPANWREWKLFGHVTCPARTGKRSKTCGNAECAIGARCWRMADLGLTGYGKPIKRKRRVLCEARTRAGGFCRMRVEPGKHRCRLHGGLSTGPKTPEGKVRCADGTRRWRERQRDEESWRKLNIEIARQSAARLSTSYTTRGGA